MQPIDFVRDFLSHIDKVGIYDEYDKDSNKMITSKGVQELIDKARSAMPEKLSGKQAAKAMRELDPDFRDMLIEAADKTRVIDMRAEFARRMAQNGGARGILEQLVEAYQDGDTEKAALIFLDAEGIVKGPENVSSINSEHE